MAVVYDNGGPVWKNVMAESSPEVQPEGASMRQVVT